MSPPFCLDMGRARRFFPRPFTRFEVIHPHFGSFFEHSSLPLPPLRRSPVPRVWRLLVVFFFFLLTGGVYLSCLFFFDFPAGSACFLNNEHRPLPIRRAPFLFGGRSRCQPSFFFFFFFFAASSRGRRPVFFGDRPFPPRFFRRLSTLPLSCRTFLFVLRVSFFSKDTCLR